MNDDQKQILDLTQKLEVTKAKMKVLRLQLKIERENSEEKDVLIKMLTELGQKADRNSSYNQQLLDRNNKIVDYLNELVSQLNGNRNQQNNQQKNQQKQPNRHNN